MNADKKFAPLSSKSQIQTNRGTHKRSTVVKNDLVRVNAPLKIEFDDIESEQNEIESIEPIIENGDVIGIVHKCSCGKKSEIHFEYK